MTVIYAGLKLLPARDRVVLMSRLYSRTSHDFAALEAEIRRQSPLTSVTVLNHRNTSVLRVPAQMLVEMYHLATARTCITDSYMAAISVLRHRDALTVVQMWHALGAIKRFGLAALGSAEGRPGPLAHVMRMHAGYDWVIAGGPRMVEPFAASFGVRPDQVLPIGTPRVDALRDPAFLARKRTRIRAAHPTLGVRPVLLYAPTFRTSEPVHVDALLDAVDADAFDVVVALHPLDRRDFTGRRGVVQDAAFSTLDWLSIADHVVSDYSAIVFDAAVVGLPIWLYAYDLAEYRERRGLFFDLDADPPAPVFSDAGELIAAIRAAGDLPGAALDSFVTVTDGGCTRRLAALALGAAPGELR